MTLSARLSIAVLVLTTLVAACAPVGGRDAGPTGGNERSAVKKRAVVAWVVPQGLGAVSTLTAGNEGTYISALLHAGFGMHDDQQRFHPQLAEEVPTLDNGLWKLLPGGRMETTWKLKPNARWQDGVQVTTADFVFGAMVGQDKELALRSSLAPWDAVEGIEALDDLTVTIRWKVPHIEADVWMGSADQLLPKHLLEQPYLEDRTRFTDHPYWSDAFIGAGPFRLKEYERGSRMLLEAFDGYALGRPRLDEIEVRLVADTSALTAQVLAGDIDTNIGAQSLAPDQAEQLRHQWREGRVVTSPFTTGNIAIFPQMLNPTMPIVLNPQFRRALLHALNREEMVETIMLGEGGVSHMIVSEAMPEYQAVQDAAVRYDYDPRKAAQILDELGLRKGGDGFYQDADGQRLTVDLRVLESDPQDRVRATFVAADYWKKVGLDTTPVVVPPQQALDRAYVSDFPMFFVQGCTSTYDRVTNCFHSSQARTAATRFNGPNRSRYMNPELDALLDRFITTVPLQERVQPLREAIRIETEQAVWMGLFRNAYNTLMSNRLANRQLDTYRTRAAFSHLWDIT
jgi:peptide/nickel transport system substrate-binding protein